MGCAVSLICFEFNNWSKSTNDKLLQEVDFKKLIIIPAGRTPFFSWIKSVLVEKLFRFIKRVAPLTLPQLSFAVSRRSFLLLEAIKKIDSADFVIGHNPGAIYATYKAAQLFNCKSGFDVEDYHPGEGNNQQLQQLTLLLMQKLLPKFNVVSFASESIFIECKKSISNFKDQSTAVVINSFPQHEFIEPPKKHGEKLQLVWFSQQIDKGRGLENIIPIISKHADKISLTLFGNFNPTFKKECIDTCPCIQLGGILPQTTLHHTLSTFDVGLAIEPGKDLNNELALSNKLLAYIQAGLFVLATNTIEQDRFLQSSMSTGVCVDKNFSNFEDKLMQLYADRNNIRSLHDERYNHAKIYSWENTTNTLTSIWAI